MKIGLEEEMGCKELAVKKWAWGVALERERDPEGGG